MLVCADIPELREMLTFLGAECLFIAKNGILPDPVADHADMLCYAADERTGFSYDISLIETLNGRERAYRLPAEPLGGKYPGDVRLNCLRLGKKLIANTKYCSKDVLCDAEKRGMDIIHVNQGYARCSTLAVTDNAVITADDGIAAALERSGVEVLKIRPGHINIPRYEYGFIGGAGARISAGGIDMILFYGDPQTHPDGRRIIDFIDGHGLSVYCSGNHELTDFGSCVEV